MNLGAAHVEIVSDYGDGPLLPKKVLINGHDVGLVAEGGVRVEVGGNNNMTTVTITLIPSRVTLRHVDSGAELGAVKRFLDLWRVK